MDKRAEKRPGIHLRELLEGLKLDPQAERNYLTGISYIWGLQTIQSQAKSSIARMKIITKNGIGTLSETDLATFENSAKHADKIAKKMQEMMSKNDQLNKLALADEEPDPTIKSLKEDQMKLNPATRRRLSISESLDQTDADSIKAKESIHETLNRERVGFMDELISILTSKKTTHAKVDLSDHLIKDTDPESLLVLANKLSLIDHDLRQPITAILGFAQLCTNRVQEGEIARVNPDKINADVKELDKDEKFGTRIFGQLYRLNHYIDTMIPFIKEEFAITPDFTPDKARNEIEKHLQKPLRESGIITEIVNMDSKLKGRILKYSHAWLILFLANIQHNIGTKAFHYPEGYESPIPDIKKCEISIKLSKDKRSLELLVKNNGLKFPQCIVDEGFKKNTGGWVNPKSKSRGRAMSGHNEVLIQYANLGLMEGEEQEQITDKYMGRVTAFNSAKGWAVLKIKIPLFPQDQTAITALPQN